MSATAWVHIEREHDVPLAVGPYPGLPAATRAMQDSLLIDGLCQQDATDCFVTTEPAPHAEQVTPDLTDPGHTGE